SDAGASPVMTSVTVTNGTVNVTAPGSITAVGNGTAVVTLTGPQAGVNQALATLTFTGTLNYNGPANLQIVTNDQGNTGAGGPLTDTDNLPLTVAPVNDVPTFSLIAVPNQNVNEDSGPQAPGSVIPASSPGPVNEAGQTIDFIVTNNNNALFGVQPAIAPNGNLTYTPGLNANGVATITVAIHDNGGTANGGVDTSPTQTFTITVNPLNDAPVGTPNTVTTVESTPRAFLVGDFGFTDPTDTPPNAFSRVQLTTLPA